MDGPKYIKIIKLKSMHSIKMGKLNKHKIRKINN